MTYQITRDFHTETSYNEKFKIRSSIDRSYRNKLRRLIQPTKKCLLGSLLNKIPILKWLPEYRFTENILKDTFAGVTVGIIQIAPTLANSYMAGLPPINGLYVAFIASMIYAFFGTSRQLSMGTNGVICLMIQSGIDKFEGVLYDYEPSPSKNFSRTESTSNKTLYLSDNPDEAKVIIAANLSLMVGVIHVILGILKGGLIARFFSSVLINAFIVAVSYVIIIGQIKVLLDIRLPKSQSPFKLIENINNLFRNLSHMNFASLIISVTTVPTLYVVNRFLNVWFKKKFKVPIPIELIVIIVTDLLSHFLKFNEVYGVKVLGSIPNNFPVPHFHRIEPIYLVDMFEDALSIAVVSFSLNVSFAKYFSIKNDHEIDPNQELISYGIGNIICGFLDGFPSSSNFSRSLNVEQIGSKFQIFSFISSLFALAAIVGIGFLFQYLPNCVLASIIVYSLIDQCANITEIFSIFKKSKIEGLTWIGTFLGVVILDIKWGLYIGLIISIMVIVLRTQYHSIKVLGKIAYTIYFEDINFCKDAMEFDGIKILRYDSSIYFGNVENFMHKVKKKLDIKVEDITKDLKKLNAKLISFQKSNDGEFVRLEIERILKSVKVKHLVLDMSYTNMIDSTAYGSLIVLRNVLQEIGIRLHLVGFSRRVMEKLDRLAFDQKFSYNYIYPSIQDALDSIFANDLQTTRF